MIRVLIVCTGNTCRSPMAEVMLKDLAERSGKKLEVRSAGVSTADGLPISSHAAAALRRRNLTLPGASTALSLTEVEWADFILTMTAGHKRAILQRFPEGVNKTYTLKEFAMQGDPVMGDVAEAEKLYTEWQVRKALGQSLTPEEHARLNELQRRIPDFDIADPFGGSLSIYERTADEIEEVLLTLLDKLEEDHKNKD